MPMYRYILTQHFGQPCWTWSAAGVVPLTCAHVCIALPRTLSKTDIYLRPDSQPKSSQPTLLFQSHAPSSRRIHILEQFLERLPPRHATETRSSKLHLRPAHYETPNWEFWRRSLTGLMERRVPSSMTSADRWTAKCIVPAYQTPCPRRQHPSNQTCLQS